VTPRDVTGRGLACACQATAVGCPTLGGLPWQVGGVARVFHRPHHAPAAGGPPWKLYQAHPCRFTHDRYTRQVPGVAGQKVIYEGAWVVAAVLSDNCWAPCLAAKGLSQQVGIRDILLDLPCHPPAGGRPLGPHKAHSWCVSQTLGAWCAGREGAVRQGLSCGCCLFIKLLWGALHVSGGISQQVGGGKYIPWLHPATHLQVNPPGLCETCLCCRADG
jgi:hypothetical protein